VSNKDQAPLSQVVLVAKQGMGWEKGRTGESQAGRRVRLEGNLFTSLVGNMLCCNRLTTHPTICSTNVFLTASRIPFA
jgi:hypothetical protein